jgi:pimeloyl-ACP methyl ester carboxylesterase
MIQTSKGYLDLGDGQLYCESAGAGAPVVLTHAGFLDCRMFDDIWEPLARNNQVVRYDMRGFGQSSPAAGPVCRRADLDQLLKHLGLTHVHLVGCSMGGQICLDLALEQPELIASLTLVDSAPSGFELQGAMPRYMPEMIAALQSGDVEQASELQIRIWLDGEARDAGQVDPELRRKALKMNRIAVARNTFFLVDQQPAKPLDPPAVTRLEEVSCPTLIVVGSLDHLEVLRAGEVMATRIPNARKITLEGSGHVPSYEQPENFVSRLLEFLGDVNS